MSTSTPAVTRIVQRTTAALLASVLVLTLCPALQAQGLLQNRAVGGISIDTNGVLANAEIDVAGKLSQLRAKALAKVPDELNQTTELRKISLRRLDAAIRKCIDDGKDLPDEIKYLAGLQQIRYVFVYPEENDIILAGPGEGWKVDKRGNVVGVNNGRPVLLLDDLLVAFRTARQTAHSGISCSIDPTEQGLARLRSHVAGLRTIGRSPRKTVAKIEEQLGAQVISVTGVPASSHFARVMVAADYRMKRLAMDFEPSPIKELPSFLKMMKPTSHGMSNMLPRWWLEPSYAPLLRDVDGMAWELRGGTVKAMAEDDFLTASGTRQHTGKANPVARKWADNMTAHYDELAVADPIFGQLRNCMELAIVAALIVEKDLTAKAGCEIPALLSSSAVDIAKFTAARQVDTQASMLKKGRNWVISASGGVLISTRAIIRKTKKTDTLDEIRKKAAKGELDNWWWN